MKNINKQIDVYLEKREVKHHDVELLKLIQNDFPEFKGELLDIGCAAGALIDYMISAYPNASYTGFDISFELIKLAQEKKIKAKCNFFVNDAMTFSPQCTYDIIIASGIMSIFDDFTVPLKKWLSWLKNKGVLYIFGRFNTKNIDTIIHFKNNYNGSNDWEGGLTSYSIKTVNSFCESLGYSAKFTKFHLPIKLDEDKNPIRTYTKETTTGEILVVNGANIIAEHYFCRITQK